MEKWLIQPLESFSQIAMYIGENLFGTELVDFCAKRKGKKFFIADEVVQELYAKDVARRLSAELCTIPNGEKAKTLEVAQALLSELFQKGADRDSTLIAMGGGAATDLVGFVASIYMRGLPLILLPTTLLGIVDAAIGGKTGIDTPFGKNLIGTTHHPIAIFADLQVLNTLSEKEWLGGLAEILKMGLIRDASLWQKAVKNRKDPDLIMRAIQGKIAVIEQDPKEHGLRRLLNFGHTIGHALEALSHYELSHGEAVAIGCAAESYLSMRLGYLAEETFQEIASIYSSFPLKLPNLYEKASLVQALAHDKKRADGMARFVLLDQIGHAMEFEGHYCRPVAAHELEETLEWMEKTYR